MSLGMLRLSAEGEPLKYARHPLVYIVEAADDICYEIMDIEDAHKLGLVPTADVIELLLGYFTDDRKQRCVDVMSRVDDPNEKIVYLRSCVIGALVNACAATFVEHEDEIRRGQFKGSLVGNIPGPAAEGYRRSVKPVMGKDLPCSRCGQHRPGR